MNNPFQDKPLLEDWQKPKVLAIIPARGGSKGIQKKNIRVLCGKPLIAYSIEVALKSKAIDRVVVSTEDQEIADTARAFGAEIPILRPAELAQDRSDVSDAITHTLHALQISGYWPDILVTLFPTHPFRTPGLLDFLLKKVMAGHSPVVTVKAISRAPLSFFYRNPGGDLLPLAAAASDNGRGRRSFFRQHGLFIGSSMRVDHRPYLHVISNPVSLIDIDTLEDFHLAEAIIAQGLFDFHADEYPDSHHTRIS